MQRREFLAASAAAALGLASTSISHAAAPPSSRQILELRLYHFASPAKQKAFEEFLSKAMVPALNRAGVEPVGVFKLLAKDNAPLKLEADSTDLYVLLPHKSLESFIALEGALAKDQAYQSAGQAILSAPKNDPAYARYESTVLLAFEQCPQAKAVSKSPNRVMQLRIYESHSNERALKKIKMFNEGGEIAIFNRTGLNPIFFGQALAGAKLPNLTYMVGFEDEAAQKKAWDTFRNDPEWKKLSKDDEYKDTVSTITNLVVRPAGGSQI